MNEQMVEQANEIDIFNSGCDLVLSHIEKFILNLEEAGDPVGDKYEKLVKMVVGMRAVVEKRRAVKEEEPTIAVPEQKIIIPN
jgi:hypothetical protein